MRKIWSSMGLLLILALGLSSCGTRITADEIVTKMRETLESTHDAHAIVTANVNVQGIDIAVRAEIWEKSPNMFRVEVLESSQSNVDGMVVVSDGQQGWAYDPVRNAVTVGSADEIDTPLPQEMLSELQHVIQAVLDASNVELVGEEQVAGQDSYKLTLTSKEDAERQVLPGNGIATLWVDQKQWIILKATYEASAIGQGAIEVQSYELNTGLADDLFHFEIPEDVQVIEAATEEIQPLTLAEAQAQAEFPLLVPATVPGGATLVEVFAVGGSFVLRYDHSPAVSFTIMQGPELQGPPPLGDSQNITVREQKATVITDESGGNTFLYWTEGGVTITVAGHISLDDALLIAEALQ